MGRGNVWTGSTGIQSERDEGEEREDAPRAKVAERMAWPSLQRVVHGRPPFIRRRRRCPRCFYAACCGYGMTMTPDKTITSGAWIFNVLRLLAFSRLHR